MPKPCATSRVQLRRSIPSMAVAGLTRGFTSAYAGHGRSPTLLRPCALTSAFGPLSSGHALRVGLATAAGTAVAHLQLAHGIWVPMATLIVLQPEFGGTLDRALQRTAGTVAGAALAGLMLATLSGTAVFEVLLIA